MTVEAPLRSPDQDELQALIEEARQRARRRRRRNGIALAAAALVATGSYLLMTRLPDWGPKGGTGSNAAMSAKRAAIRGRFWYTRTISSQHQWMPAGGMIEWRRGYFRPRGPEVRFDLRVSEETWVGIDGTMRERVIVTSARFASAADRAKWAADGRPVPNFNNAWLGWMSHDGITIGGGKFPPQPFFQGGEWLGPYGWDVGDSLFSYRQLLSLPTEAGALRARLRRAEKALVWRQDKTGAHGVGNFHTDAYRELSDIAGLLISPLPAAGRLALFHAAVSTPGTTVNTHARDSLGRLGVAVSASAGLAFERLIFNPATGALLERAPNVTVVAQGAVDSAYALPKAIGPIRAPGVPPQPQASVISPAVGTPTTVFRLMLPAPTRRARRAPTLDVTLIGSPGLRCFAGFAPPLAALAASASVRLAGRLSYVYRLNPSLVHRQTWCPGRYELAVAPDNPHRSRVMRAEILAPVLTEFFSVERAESQSHSDENSGLRGSE